MGDPILVAFDQPSPNGDVNATYTPGPALCGFSDDLCPLRRESRATRDVIRGDDETAEATFLFFEDGQGPSLRVPWDIATGEGEMRAGVARGPVTVERTE